MWKRTTASLLVMGGAMVAVPEPVAAAINPADFQQVELARGVAELGEPISLAVLPDSSVLHTDRRGVLRRTDNAGNTAQIGTVAVYSHDEEGLQGVGVDSGFATNRFIYFGGGSESPMGGPVYRYNAANAAPTCLGGGNQNWSLP